jgi:hypothetical protein
MKTNLLISLILNGVFLVFIAWSATTHAFFNQPPLTPPQLLIKPASIDLVAKTPPVAPALEPFHWSQVESEDYSTYIFRLRAIGCPEKTIRQIVSGELSDMLTDKRAQLQKQYGRNLLPAEVRKLEQEHSNVLASVMQAEPSDSPSAIDQTPASSSLLPLAASRIQYPLALRPVAAASINSTSASHSTSGTATPTLLATPAQEQALSQIGQNFSQDMGGPNQNPADPQYLARWTKAQQQADNRMRSLMGVGYYNAYGIKLAAKANEDTQK